MSTWLYYSPRPDGAGFSPFSNEPTGEGVESVGRRELDLMLRARQGRHGQLTIPHDRAHNAERMALRRLVQRGLFSMRAFGTSTGIGFTYVYELTDRGRECWLRTREK